MVTTASVGKWLFDKIVFDKYVSQDSVVIEIKKQFGSIYVYINDNGNLAIDKQVLKEFNKLKKTLKDTEIIEWDNSDKAWRYKDSLVK